MLTWSVTELRFNNRSFRRKTRGYVFRLTVAVFSVLVIFFTGCDSEKAPTIATPLGTPPLEIQDVQTLITHAVEQAERLGVAANIAVTDREANVLGVFVMNGSTGSTVDPVAGSIAKARTASYLSSNQHGFSTLTACFITRNHFPPAIDNTPAGPLFGVPFSSLGGGDIQPNGGAAPGFIGLGQPGLTGVPGGLPIFKDGLLAGGLGVSGSKLEQADIDQILCCCGGVLQDEVIALGAVEGGYAVPDDKRGDGIFIDGIRFLFANAQSPSGNFTLSFPDLASRGAVDANFPIRASLPPKFPLSGEVNLDPLHDFRIRAGVLLSATEVRTIINQAAAQAARTRAAIRRPLGVPAQVFISVVDIDGQVLGISRTPDATLFSYDVSAQKARTALAFSDPNHPFGGRVRGVLGLAQDQGLAMTTRAIGFLSQDFYPPGIDRETLDKPVEPGPLFEGPEFQLQVRLGFQPYGNGITIFPGGVPLYKNGQLAGAVGVSGDGVDQDDIICFAGSIGFEPPEAFRCDQFSYRGAKLPYVKFPRQPELD